jgi:hypothetical protein
MKDGVTGTVKLSKNLSNEVTTLSLNGIGLWIYIRVFILVLRTQDIPLQYKKQIHYLAVNDYMIM